MKSVYIAVDPELEAEKAENHLRLIRREFDSARFLGKLKLLHTAELFYPGHPITVEMHKDFEFENKQ